MRDAHRMKEKFDLSLDNRQIVSLFIASIVVLGAVFVIGVVVGKKMAVPPTAKPTSDLLTALDQKAAQMELARKDPPLTFQEELTRRAPDPVVAEPEAPAVKPPAPVNPATHVVATADVSAAPTLAKALIPAAPKPLTSKLPELDGHVANTPVATRTAEKDDLHSAFARIEQAAAKNPSGAFSIQIAASQSRPDAEAKVARLKARGYAPYIVTADVPGKGIWFRVRVGSFPTREAASHYLDDFRRETRMDAFVASGH